MVICTHAQTVDTRPLFRGGVWPAYEATTYIASWNCKHACTMSHICRAGREATNCVAWRLHVACKLCVCTWVMPQECNYYKHISRGHGIACMCSASERYVSVHYKLACGEAAAIGRLQAQQHKSSGSEERKGTSAGCSLTAGKTDSAAGKWWPPI